jgi:hypothetical protein
VVGEEPAVADNHAEGLFFHKSLLLQTIAMLRFYPRAAAAVNGAEVALLHWSFPP